MQQAIDAGVSAPWYVCEDEPFWGQDRLDLARKWQNSVLFASSLPGGPAGAGRRGARGCYRRALRSERLPERGRRGCRSLICAT
jgi:hypothetical protein